MSNEQMKPYIRRNDLHLFTRGMVVGLFMLNSPAIKTLIKASRRAFISQLLSLLSSSSLMTIRNVGRQCDIILEIRNVFPANHIDFIKQVHQLVVARNP